MQQDGLSPFCQEAESSCCENEDHYLKIANRVDNYTETFGLYDECKCAFWFCVCEDTQADAAIEGGADQIVGLVLLPMRGAVYWTVHELSASEWAAQAP